MSMEIISESGWQDWMVNREIEIAFEYAELSFKWGLLDWTDIFQHPCKTGDKIVHKRGIEIVFGEWPAID